MSRLPHLRTGCKWRHICCLVSNSSWFVAVDSSRLHSSVSCLVQVSISSLLWNLSKSSIQNLHRPNYSTAKRLIIAYAICVLLATESTVNEFVVFTKLIKLVQPFLSTFLDAPASYVSRFDRLTRHIHHLTINEQFVVYGAMMLPSSESVSICLREFHDIIWKWMLGDE